LFADIPLNKVSNNKGNSIRNSKKKITTTTEKKVMSTIRKGKYSFAQVL
jgi:hypothetical protein